MIIIAWILALVSLVIIIYIFIRKFPILANIDVSQIEAERQADLKRKILSDKFKRSFNRGFNQFLKLAAPVGRLLAGFFQWLYNKLINLRENYSHEAEAVNEDLAKKIEMLFAEAQDLVHKEDFAKAESKYIEIIGLDSKNYKAFELLAENYFERENYEEAEQTLEHTIKLKEQLKKAGRDISDLEMAKSFFSLGLVYEKLNNLQLAFDKFKVALELEPSNPRQLDKMTELCIIMKDAPASRQYCQRLEETNPGNKKLKDLKTRIRDLEAKEEVKTAVDETKDVNL
jgi:tetratricopeptide (TPR) repeat protein